MVGLVGFVDLPQQALITYGGSKHLASGEPDLCEFAFHSVGSGDLAESQYEVFKDGLPTCRGL